MSRNLKTTNGEEPDPVNEDNSTLHAQHNGNSNGPQVMFPSRNLAPMPARVKMATAQSKDPYCLGVWAIVGTDPKWLFNENGLLC